MNILIIRIYEEQRLLFWFLRCYSLPLNSTGPFSHAITSLGESAADNSCTTSRMLRSLQEINQNNDSRSLFF